MGLTTAPLAGADGVSAEGTFFLKICGCDDVYAGGGSALLPPDLSAMELRYRPAYIHPVHETGVSGTGGVATFLQNVGFGFWSDYGKALWDQVLPIRGLPVSTPDYWTVMVVAAFQAEEDRDYDPDGEAGSSGLVLGINTHDDGATGAIPVFLGPSYTGVCAVFRVVLGEVEGREPFTVVHEVGHTFGLAHNDIRPGDPPVDAMDPFGEGQELPFKAGNLKKLREYDGP